MKSKPTAHPLDPAVAPDRNEAVSFAQAAGTHPESFRIARILVPIDFSDCSRKALEYALPFARQFGASLTLLSVVQVAYANIGGDGIDLLQVQMDEEKITLEKLDALAREEVGEGIRFDTVVRCGQAMSEIIDMAKERQIDLIIISTHGYTGFKRMMLGSTTEKVVRHAPCPVLVVREKKHEFVPVAPNPLRQT